MDNVDITKNTYKEIYKSYTENNSALNDTVKKMLDRFILLLTGEKNVLDVGCANGRESKYLFENNCVVTGIDSLEEFTELAKKNCPKCSFLVCDMRKLPFETSVFDGIWASASFLHIPKKDAPATLKGFNKVLKAKGVLYVSVMQGDFDDTRTNEAMKWNKRHFSDYQQSELENLLKRAQFEVISSDKVTTHWGPTFLHYFCRKV